MVEVTTDKKDPRLGHGIDEQQTKQNEVYLVLSLEEKAKGFLRPVRYDYKHSVCGEVTTMAPVIAETYARNPTFYGSTFCVYCKKHLDVSEFNWLDGSVVGS